MNTDEAHSLTFPLSSPCPSHNTTTTDSNFVLGNAQVAKIYPIVYCSDGFCELTGYSRAQIMQKSCACNFLYGPRTEPTHQSEICKALESKQELKLELIFYKSTGKLHNERLRHGCGTIAS